MIIVNSFLDAAPFCLTLNWSFSTGGEKSYAHDSNDLARKTIKEMFVEKNRNGNIKIMIKNPQVYKEGHVYPPHIHYKVSNKEGNDYTNDFFTQTYLGIINYKQMMQHVNSKKYVIINALPSEYFAKYQIPNSVNLPYNKCKKMTTEEIHKFMKDILIYNLRCTFIYW